MREIYSKKALAFCQGFFEERILKRLLFDHLFDFAEVVAFDFDQVDAAAKGGKVELVSQGGEGLTEYLTAMDVGE